MSSITSEIDLVMACLATTDKPDFQKVAEMLGIEDGAIKASFKVQRLFKKAIESTGAYVLKDGKVTPVSEVNSAPETSKSASKVKKSTPKNTGRKRKATEEDIDDSVTEENLALAKQAVKVAKKARFADEEV